MLFNFIQYFAYWWSSTFHFIPSRILPSVIGRHREADDHAQGGKADIQANTLDVSRCFVVGEAKGSQDGETLPDGVEHAQGYSALALPRNNPIPMEGQKVRNKLVTYKGMALYLPMTIQIHPKYRALLLFKTVRRMTHPTILCGYK